VEKESLENRRKSSFFDESGKIPTQGNPPIFRYLRATCVSRKFGCVEHRRGCGEDTDDRSFNEKSA
jgi:hypothetical protein